MVTYISDIISRFGGRYAGSEQEKQAQEHTAGILKNYCNKVEIQSFKAPLMAHFEALKIFCILFWVGLVLYKVNLTVATIIASVNFILFFGHFLTYRHWLDFLFRKQESWNVTGTIEPEGEVKSTLLVAGHIDSVKEFKWWFRLKGFGLILNTIAGFSFLFQAIFYVIAAFIFSKSGSLPGYFEIIWWVFIVVSPAAITFFDKHGKNVVDGALDNLTGVAMAVEMAKVFSEKKLKNTRLKLVSFGSEEPALRGSFAYARANKEILKKENATLINLDTIKELKHLTLVPVEVNTLVSYPKELVKKMENSFKAVKVDFKKLPLPVGATDGSAFAIEGLPAISIIGMDSSKYDPCYHTRLDNLSNLDPEGMEALKKVLVHFIEAWDSDQA